VLAATAHLTPAESRALGRAISRIVGILIRDLGWGWGLTVAVSTAFVGWAAWTAPTWWNALMDWLEQ
jgi:hypothetical protein